MPTVAVAEVEKTLLACVLLLAEYSIVYLG